MAFFPSQSVARGLWPRRPGRNARREGIVTNRRTTENWRYVDFWLARSYCGPQPRLHSRRHKDHPPVPLRLRRATPLRRRPAHRGRGVAPSAEAQNYLLNVLRLRQGDAILVFNGRDGEWRATIDMVSKRAAALRVEQRLREQTAPGDLDYAFAPLKQARLDYMAQKATEMGASRLTPVLTKRTQMRRVSAHRLRANAIEAAEQCGLLTIPETLEPVELDRYLAGLEPQRLLVFCDEDAPVTNALATLRGKGRRIARAPSARRADRPGGRVRRNGARHDIEPHNILAFHWVPGYCARTRRPWRRSR